MAFSATSPVRASHRIVWKLCSVVLGSKVDFKPVEFDRVTRVFSKAGGSWVRVFHGSPDDLGLLKKILVTAFKHGFLTKKEKWT